jgi:hypothetical protein
VLLANGCIMWKKLPGTIYVSNTAADSIVRFANATRQTGNVIPNAARVSPKLELIRLPKAL